MTEPNVTQQPSASAPASAPPATVWPSGPIGVPASGGNGSGRAYAPPSQPAHALAPSLLRRDAPASPVAPTSMSAPPPQPRPATPFPYGPAAASNAAPVPLTTVWVAPAVAPASAASRRSRAPSVALVLSALVAVGGVSYAIGRWSVGGSPTGGTSESLAAAGAGVVGGLGFPSDSEGAFPAGIGLPGGAGPADVSSTSGNGTDPGSIASDAGVGSGSPSQGLGSGAAPNDATTDRSTLAGVGLGQPSEQTSSSAVAGGALTQADDPDGSVERGGFGGPGGFGGRGGLQGTLTAVGADSLTIDISGQEQTVGIDDGTTFVRQHAASADEIAPGDLISVGYAFGGSAGDPPDGGVGGFAPPDGAGPPADPSAEGGPPSAADLTDAVAATITILPPGTASGTRFGIEGTVQGAADGSLIVATADGESRLVSTDEATTYGRDEPISSTDLVVGDDVRIQLAFTGPPGGGGTVPDGSLPSASRVVLLDTDGS